MAVLFNKDTLVCRMHSLSHLVEHPQSHEEKTGPILSSGKVDKILYFPLFEYLLITRSIEDTVPRRSTRSH
ncbi:unnamed protein product, partial [Nesidiocoris tenuis]